MIDQSIKWDAFVDIVCELLDAHGYIGDKVELANCLDMTFEELENIPLKEWYNIIEYQLIEYKMNEGYELFDK